MTVEAELDSIERRTVADTVKQQSRRHAESDIETKIRRCIRSMN